MLQSLHLRDSHMPTICMIVYFCQRIQMVLKNLSTCRWIITARQVLGLMFFNFNFGREVWEVLLLSVCLSVCLSARTSQKRHVQTSRNFPYTLPVAVARSSSDDNAIRYVFPVLWMTSCFHVMCKNRCRLGVCDVANYSPSHTRWRHWLTWAVYTWRRTMQCAHGAKSAIVAIVD